MSQYCFDANTVINLHRRFPRDVWPTVWERTSDLIESGRAFLPREVLIELGRIDDDCVEWCRSFEQFVVEPSEDEILTVADIANRHSGWITAQQNQADPWLVAHGLHHGRVIVTEERRRGQGVEDHNLGIPNVADEYGVDAMTFNELARTERWIF